VVLTFLREEELTPEELDAIKQKIMDSEEDRMKIEILPAADQSLPPRLTAFTRGLLSLW